MPHTNSSAKSQRSARGAHADAIALLRADHKHVDGLFKSFDKIKKDDESKAELVGAHGREASLSDAEMHA